MSQNVIRTKKTEIVIAGGGFVGLTAARYFDQGLARRGDIEVVLISRENFTLFTPMLHEVATGDLYPGDIVNPLRRVLHHVKVVEAEVRSIDVSARRIHCARGSAELEVEFEFNHLRTLEDFHFAKPHGCTFRRGFVSEPRASVTDYAGALVQLNNGTSIPAAT